MNTKRILSLVLALATVFSTVGLTALTAFADDGLLFSENFEGYTTSTKAEIAEHGGTKYPAADGFHYVLDIEGEHGNVAYMPNVYHGGFTKSPTLSYTVNGGKITVTADYCINVPEGVSNEAFNFAIRSASNATFESDSTKPGGGMLTEGNWPAFACIRGDSSAGENKYRLYLDTSKSGGYANANEDIFYAATGVESVLIDANTWFTVIIDFDLAAGTYILSYKDAESTIVLGQARPCASYHDGNAWQMSTGMRNITMNADTFATGYVLDAGYRGDNWGETAVLMDNVRFEHTKNAPVIDTSIFSSETFDYGTYTPSTAEEVANKTATRYGMNDSFCYVRDVDGEHENVAWLPNVYHAGYTKSPALSYTVNSGRITASADYYLNVPQGSENEELKVGIRTVGQATFESNTALTSASNLAFAYLASAGNGTYRLYLDTSHSGGWINSNEDIFYTTPGVEYVEVAANTWFTVVIDFDLVAGTYILTYRDSSGDTVIGQARPVASFNEGGNWKYSSGIRNITIPQDTISMGYMLNAGFNDDNWHDDNFNPSLWGESSVYVDNVRFGYTKNAPVIDTSVIAAESFDNGTYIAATPEEIVGGTATQYPTSGSGFHYVLDVNGEHENVAWLHNVYHSGYDRSPTLSYTDKDGKFTLSADYCINVPQGYENETFKFGIRSTSGATFESDSTDGEDNMITSGNWPSFAYIESTGTGTYRLYLDTSRSGGYLNSNEALFYPGDAEYVEFSANTWFTVLIDLDLVTGMYTLTYRDAGGDVVLGSARACASYNNGTGWVPVTNMRNITLPANTVAAAYVLPSGASDESANQISLYVDNVRFGYASSDVELVTVESENLMYVLKGGKKIFSNQFYASPEDEYLAVYFKPEDYAGLLATEQAASVRISVPTGLRFATKLDEEKLEELYALKTAGDIADVTFGTLIAPTDYVTDALSMEALTLAGKSYLAVEAVLGKYFKYDSDPDTTHYVGSIVDMYEWNVARNFSACGYATVTLRTGQTVNLYSATKHSANVKNIASAALADTEMLWPTDAKTVLETFAAGQLPALSEVAQQRRDMNGLNVLAIGDSLFGGHSLADGEQWLELLAKECKWNLTNLGANGWVVADNPEAFGSNPFRPSMYEALMNNADFCFGSTALTDIVCTVGNTANKTNEDVDLIFLEGGWNDYNNFIPLGTPTDTDGSTYMGAINGMVAKLHEIYPNAKIVLTTSWHNEGTRTSDGAKWMDFLAGGMKSVYNQNYADKDYVCVLDAGDPNVSGVRPSDPSWAATYAMDAAHLNAAGMRVMADNMLPLVWEIATGGSDAE